MLNNITILVPIAINSYKISQLFEIEMHFYYLYQKVE